MIRGIASVLPYDLVVCLHVCIDYNKLLKSKNYESYENY